MQEEDFIVDLHDGFRQRAEDCEVSLGNHLNILSVFCDGFRFFLLCIFLGLPLFFLSSYILKSVVPKAVTWGKVCCSSPHPPTKS